VVFTQALHHPFVTLWHQPHALAQGDHNQYEYCYDYSESGFHFLLLNDGHKSGLFDQQGVTGYINHPDTVALCHRSLGNYHPLVIAQYRGGKSQATPFFGARRNYDLADLAYYCLPGQACFGSVGRQGLQVPEPGKSENRRKNGPAENLPVQTDSGKEKEHYPDEYGRYTKPQNKKRGQRDLAQHQNDTENYPVPV
jgi:hypothetical protein